MAFDDLRQRLANWAGRIVRLTQFTSAKSDGSAAVAGRSMPGGPEALDIPSRLAAPFGLRSVPPAGVDCAELRSQGVIDGSMALPLDSVRYGPNDVASGDVALFTKDNAQAVRLIGQDVVVNQGTKQVVLDGDSIDCGTLVVVTTAGVVSAITYFGPGIPTGALPAGGAAIVMSGKAQSSATHFKGK